MNDPLPLVCRLEHKLSWAETKALVMLVGMSSSPASDLAAALGVGDEQLEAIYRETRKKRLEAACAVEWPRPQLGVVA